MNSNINILEDIQPLTQFRQKAADTLKRIAETKRPAFLTVNGKVEAVLQDAAEYQNIMDRLERLEEYVKILSGLDDIERGDFSDAEEFVEGLSRENV